MRVHKPFLPRATSPFRLRSSSTSAARPLGRRRMAHPGLKNPLKIPKTLKTWQSSHHQTQMIVDHGHRQSGCRSCSPRRLVTFVTTAAIPVRSIPQSSCTIMTIARACLGLPHFLPPFPSLLSRSGLNRKDGLIGLTNDSAVDSRQDDLTGRIGTWWDGMTSQTRFSVRHSHNGILQHRLLPMENADA